MNLFLGPPTILLAIENQFINRSTKVQFEYGNSYQISCIAQNSIRLASLSIYANSLNLNELSSVNDSTVVVNHMESTCILNNSVCYSSLVLNVTFNDIRLAEVDRIACVATNKTYPFNFTSSYSVEAESKPYKNSLN